MAISRYYDGLAAGSHAITVTVVGDGEVAMDFVDLWDGTALADGSFDQNGDRILLSAGWSQVTNGSAGGGDYLRASRSTVWFPFTGDSVTFQPFKNGAAGKIRVITSYSIHYTKLYEFSPRPSGSTTRFEAPMARSRVSGGSSRTTSAWTRG